MKPNNQSSLLRPMTGCAVFTLVVATLAGDPLPAGMTGSFPASPAPADIEAKLCRLPIQFEANQGQADARFPFLARGTGFNLLLSPQGSVIQWPNQRPLRVQLVAANPDTRLTAIDPQPAQANYLLGADPSRWITGVRAYGKIKWNQVYPGVDMVLYGQQRQLEYDFVVAPGADPGLIQWGFEGARHIGIESDGGLRLETDNGTLRHLPPVAYQEINGQRQFISARFKRLPGYAGDSAAQIGFELGAYDSHYPLVIDPVLEFATFLGGAGEDRAYGVATDSRGGVYVIGQTASPNFPLANPMQNVVAGGFDVFVMKLDPSARSVLYSTLIGGSKDDKGCGIAVDSTGCAVIAGITQSANFPTVKPFQEKFGGGDRDGFLARLSENGSELVFSSFLGGGGSDDAVSVAVGPADAIYVVGDTASTDFPVQQALQAVNRGKFDGFVAQFSRDGFLNYGTYLGGSGAFDSVLSVAVDGAGDAFVVGYTSSTNFPLRQPLQTVLRGAYDAFVAKMNPKGSELLFSTFLGGSGDDTARGVAVDREGNACVSGDTSSTDFPVTNALQSLNRGGKDAFVIKLNAAGSAMVYSTYLGGNGDETAAIAVGEDNCVYLTGLTSSTNFPVMNAIQPRFGGGLWDAFLAKINPAGTGLVYASYLGGEGADQGSGISVQPGGVACVVGASVSPDFPTVHPLQSKHRRGGYDAFVARVVEKATEAIDAYTNNIVIAKMPAEAPDTASGKTSPAIPKPGAPVRPAKPVAVTKPAAIEPLSEDKLLTHPLFGRNIVVNSGAEAGSAANSSYGKTNVPGWTLTGNLTVLKYGTPGGFPTTNTPGPTDRGLNFFAGGPDSPVSTAAQTIDLTEIAPLVDAGWVAFKFGAFLGGVGGQKDNAVMQLVFQDADHGFLGQVSVGPVTLMDRQYKSGLLWRSATGQIPPETRQLEARLQMNRVDGKYNDAFADGLGLVLMPTKPGK